jgi:hypothetical protein
MDDSVANSNGVLTSEKSAKQQESRRRRSTFTLILFEANSRIKEQFSYDKRFHPSVIGVILCVFLLGVAYFTSYMEGINYFDSFYACFISYSTIGFGDIDIFVSIFSAGLHVLAV